MATRIARMDEVKKKAFENESLTEEEIRVLAEYCTYLEMGYAGLRRLDMVDTAKKSAVDRLLIMEKT